MTPLNEKTREECQKIFDAIVAYLRERMLTDARYRVDMTEQEYLELCEMILHEDQDATAVVEGNIGLVIADHRTGHVRGLLAQQERDRG